MLERLCSPRGLRRGQPARQISRRICVAPSLFGWSDRSFVQPALTIRRAPAGGAPCFRRSNHDLRAARLPDGPNRWPVTPLNRILRRAPAVRHRWIARHSSGFSATLTILRRLTGYEPAARVGLTLNVLTDMWLPSSRGFSAVSIARPSITQASTTNATAKPGGPTAHHAFTETAFP
jgi:hypothetical protein